MSKNKTWYEELLFALIDSDIQNLYVSEKDVIELINSTIDNTKHKDIYISYWRGWPKRSVEDTSKKYLIPKDRIRTILCKCDREIAKYIKKNKWVELHT